MGLRCSAKKVTTLQLRDGNLILLPRGLTGNCFGGQGKAEMALERFGQSPKELRLVQVAAAMPILLLLFTFNNNNASQLPA